MARRKKKNIGTKKITYRLRDWLFSRQRYWGEPIPIIHWEDGTMTTVPEDQLPLTLPVMKEIKPSGTGESPLANASDWVNVVDPATGKKGRRETNTMPQWAGSSWYFLRYVDPKNENALADFEKLKKWLPVDILLVVKSMLFFICYMHVSGINSCMISVLFQLKNHSKNYLIKG